MIKKATTLMLVVAVLAGALCVSSCTGAEGTSYLALDWSGAPLSLYFPDLPMTIYAGTYYEHPAGTSYGEYTAWDGSFYSFTYLIEANEGKAGLFGGKAGADRFYTMYLYSWGPELYYWDDASLQGLAPVSAAQDRKAADELSRAAALGMDLMQTDGFEQSGQLDLSLYDPASAEPYVYEQEGPGWRVRIEGKRYPPRL